MATFIIYPLWTKKRAQFCYDGITQWFIDNPDRDDCNTESCTIRRGHVKEDILKNSVKGVVLKEPKLKKKPAKKAAKKTSKKAPAKKTVKKPAKKTIKKVKK